MLTHLLKPTCIAMLAAFLCSTASAQSIRPYSLVYSQNLKGGTAIIGNTSMHILNGASPDLVKMNETSDGANGAGGIGYAITGNDGEDMQPAMIDAALPPVVIFNAGSNWKYNNPNSNQGTGWRTLIFPPESSWVPGTASFGYGLAQTTTIPTGKNTNYFLKTINIPSPSIYGSFNFTMSYNDGAVVYVNGVEVKRSNMPAGTVSYSTSAVVAGTTLNETFSVPATYFNAGINVIAVEIHQRLSISTDCFFDMAVQATPFQPSNATSADLLLPAGTNTIKFARLYWGGRIDNATVSAGTDTLRKIKIRKGSAGLYTAKLATATSVDQLAITATDILYQSYVDITDYIQANGSGTYTVADIPCTPGAITGGGHYAGWCIMIAYENASQPYNSIRIYDGFSQVYNTGVPVTQTVTLTGLNLPNNPLQLGDAVMSTMVWEGDGNLGASGFNPAGDYIKMNNIPVSNAVNPVSNFWNGSISRNGAFVTTKNPNYSNQMGIDIDELEVGTGYGLLPNATSVQFEFGTEADQYFPSVFAFSVRMKTPVITIQKTVTDANNNAQLESMEELTYTLAGSNLGPGSAYNTFVVDSLPTNVTYVAGSIKINSAPDIGSPTGQTDAQDGDFAFKATNGTRNYVKFFLGTGATSTSGGVMDVNATYNLSFKVKAMLIPGSITNTARITAQSQAGDVYTDESTALIGPAAGPVPVKLTVFTAMLQKQDQALLKWSTENEFNNDHFETERSEDGVHFSYLGSVAGMGTSTLTHNYSYTDHINTNASVIYYRLKIVALNGRVVYSKIVALRRSGAAGDLSVYPNPFGDDIRASLYVKEAGTANFRVISFNGAEMLNRKISLQKGANVVVLKDLERMAKGSYILEVNTGTETMITKIIKN